MSDISQSERERKEIGFWTTSPDESPGADSVDIFTHKMSEARVFLEKLAHFERYFEKARVVVELGGGQCWASCIVKRETGAHLVIGSDIGPDAVRSTGKWERVFGSRLDGAVACRSYAAPFRSGSVDLVFAFAAAHHFGAHRRTLDEIARVLRPGGHALYLHEPACRDYVYRLAVQRVNRKRPEVNEDVLRVPHLAQLAVAAGLTVDVLKAPTTTYRRPKETVYYLLLQKSRFLRDVLPCTVDVVFTKPRTAPQQRYERPETANRLAV